MTAIPPDLCPVQAGEKPSRPNSGRQRLLVGGLLLALIGFGAWVGSGYWLGSDGSESSDRLSLNTSPSSEPPQSLVPRKLSQQEWDAWVVPHLDRCKNRSLECISEQFEGLTALLNRSEINASRFADVALSMRSKWRLAKDYVPFSQGGEHEAFLRSEFEKLVLHSADLELAIRQTIEGYLQELHSLENQMLVDLRADLEELPDSLGVDRFAEMGLDKALEQAIRVAAQHSSSDFNGAIGQQLISLIAGEVLAHTAVRLGVSAGILGVGASSGWATLGVGVVAGVVVDALVTTVWRFWSDPEVELTRQIQAKLNLMRVLIVDGDSEAPGLRPRFTTLANERAVVREQALRELLMENP